MSSLPTDLDFTDVSYVLADVIIFVYKIPFMLLFLMLTKFESLSKILYDGQL